MTATAVAGDTLTDTIDDYLKDADRFVKETKVWKFNLQPRLRESLIWTDNLFLNDDNEQNLMLDKITRVSNSFDGSGSNPNTRVIRRPGVHIINDPQVLRLAEDVIPQFQKDSRGRVDDAILQTDFELDLVLPLNNEEYEKFFDRDELNILGVELRNQEYLDENRLDNTSIFLRTDIFGFISDLFDASWGEDVWVRMSNDYQEIRDPLDSPVRLIAADQLATEKEFEDFKRTENTFRASGGYNANKADISGGFEHYELELDDEQLSQADHFRRNYWIEVGTALPGAQEKRVYARYDLWDYEFNDSPLSFRQITRTNALGVEVTVGEPLVGGDQVLNNALHHRWVVGMEGMLFSKKLRGTIEAGYQYWDADDDGTTADDSDFQGFAGRFQLAYKPWAEKSTRFQWAYDRSLSYSSISNYSATHDTTFTILHDIIEDQLEADLSISWNRTAPSNGPTRMLIESGLGLTYKVTDNLDLNFRYLYRHQQSEDEIVINSAFTKTIRDDNGTPGNPDDDSTVQATTFDYTSKSDGDFYQNVLQLGFDLHF